MKISVITVVRNNPGVTEALQSIVSQVTDFPVEIVVIDGLSTDDTLDRVRAFGDRISVLVSERDGGIYDAMNKGLRRATGDVVGFLNSDDTFMDSGALQVVADAFRANPLADAVGGDIIYTAADAPDKVVRYWKAAGKVEDITRTGWVPPHPGFYASRERLLASGGFDTAFRIAGDFEFLLRLLMVDKLRIAFVARPLVNMKLGGASNASWRAILQGNKEIYRAFAKNGIRFPFTYFPRKILHRILQFHK